MDDSILLETQALSKSFTRGDETIHALSEVSLNICGGEFIALLGPSGSGKSSLLNILGATDAPTSGQMSVFGNEVDFKNQSQLLNLRRTSLGFVFQTFNLLTGLTAEENVMVTPLLNGIRTGEARRLATRMLESLGLGNRVHHYPHQLSGGQMQRVAIARAMVHKPKIILADEPTGNLDSETGHGVIELLARYCGSGTAIIMATHSIEAAARASRKIHLRDGRVLTEKN